MRRWFSVTYSPEDNGYYFEFWDIETGKDLYVNNTKLESNLYPTRYLCGKHAKRTMKALNRKPRVPLTAGKLEEDKKCQK